MTVTTVCGSLILAMARLVDGRPATTHHMGRSVMVDARVWRSEGPVRAAL